MYLSRDDILSASDLPTEDVEVPEWSGVVRVRGLSGKQRDSFEASTLVQRGRTMVPDTANIRAKLCAWTIIGEDGEPLFTQQDVDALGEHSGAALDRVFAVASRLSGMSDEDVAELEKVSGRGRSGGSSSTSPGSSAALSVSSSNGSPPGRSRSGPRT